MESHTDTATVEAPEVESTEAVESLPQETTQEVLKDWHPPSQLDIESSYNIV